MGGLPPILQYGAPVNWAHPLNRGLVSWYKVLPLRMGGLRWLDLASRNHGTLTSMGPSGATSGWGATRRTGGSGELRFDGTNDYVSVADAPSLRLTALTITAWVHPTSAAGQYDRVLGKGDTDARDYVLGKQTDNGPDNGVTFFYDNALTNHRWTTTTAWNTLVPVNTWTHLAVTYTSASATSIAIYVNGVAQAGSWVSGTGAASLVFSATPLRIGASYYGGLSEFWPGKLDDIRLYARSMAASEALALYRESQKPMTPLLNYLALPFGVAAAAVSILRQQLLHHGG